MSSTLPSVPQVTRGTQTPRRVASVVLAAIVVLGASLLAGGPDALAGAAVGLGLLAAFLSSGRLPFLAENQFGPTFAFLLLGLNYLFRVVLLVVAAIALHDATWLDRRVLGAVVIAGALAWNAVLLRRHISGRAAELPPDPVAEGGR